MAKIAAVAVILFCGMFATNLGGIPWNVERTGDFTFYNDGGYGACGSSIDANSQYLVAISKNWFSTRNPNNDPFCTSNVCVRVKYNGKTVTVPVKDKCPSCSSAHIDLSKPAFERLAPLSVGHVYGARWSFVRC